MAVTHADLAPNRRSTDLSIYSKTTAILMIVTLVFGLIAFIFSLIAEATRSEVLWLSSTNAGNVNKYECTYSGSGKMSLLCASAAFVALAIAMVVEHTYILISVSKSTPTNFMTWDPYSEQTKSLTWQAGFFFITTWICFAVGEILLLVGLSVESGHLKNWSTPRPNCLILRQGLFSAAGVFALTTVFLATGLYVTALRLQNLLQNQQNTHHTALEASLRYVSQPRPQRHQLAIVEDASPVILTSNGLELSIYMSDFDKYLDSV